MARNGVRVESVLDARVREANCQICSAFTGGHYLDTFEVLKPHVPQPGEVLAVRHLTVHRDDQTVHRGIDHRQRFLPAGGILREQHVNGVRSDLDGAVSTRDFLNRRCGGNCPDRICTQSRCSRYGLSCVAAVGFSGEGQRHRNLQAVGAVEIVVVEPPGRLGPREVGTGTAPVLSPPTRWVRRCAGS